MTAWSSGMVLWFGCGRCWARITLEAIFYYPACLYNYRIRPRSTAVFDVCNLFFEFVIRIAALKIQYSSTKFSIFSIIYQRKPGKSVLMKKTSKSPSFLLMENAKKNKKRDPLFPASMLPEKSFPIGCVLKCHFLLGLTRPPNPPVHRLGALYTIDLGHESYLGTAVV